MTQAVGRAFGAQPAPRVLYVFEPDDFERDAVERIATDLSGMAPTWRVCDHDEVARVRQASFGMVVLFGNPPNLVTDLHVIQFGGTSTTVVLRRRTTKPGSSFPVVHFLRRDQTSYATEWHVPAPLNDAYQQLIVRDLVPLVPRGNIRPDDHTGGTPVLCLSDNGRWLPTDQMHPLLVDVDGKVFALRMLGDAPWRWVLPAKADARAWVQLALRDLNAADSVSFPLITSWSEDSRYLTAAESVAAAELAHIASDRVEIERELDERERRALGKQAEAREAAERGPRALVHTQGDDLLNAVIVTLAALGFYVTKSDDTAPKGDKLEDLQVRLTTDGEEVGLVEVRGYTPGAQLSDLLRIGRFVERFVGSTGRQPDRRWYIVNQFLHRGPTERGRPLASNPAEVSTFGESGGLVIATHDLLELYLRVERGETTSAEAKSLLWRSTGYFTLE